MSLCHVHSDAVTFLFSLPSFHEFSSQLFHNPSLNPWQNFFFFYHSKEQLLPVVASPPGLACMFLGGRSRWGHRGCRLPRASCHFWWCIVWSRPPDTKAGCRRHCLRCWGSGRTPLQRSAGTAGPGCTWCLEAHWVMAWDSRARPAGSPLWLQYKETLYETEHCDYEAVSGPLWQSLAVCSLRATWQQWENILGTAVFRVWEWAVYIKLTRRTEQAASCPSSPSQSGHVTVQSECRFSPIPCYISPALFWNYPWHPAFGMNILSHMTPFLGGIFQLIKSLFCWHQLLLLAEEMQNRKRSTVWVSGKEGWLMGRARKQTICDAHPKVEKGSEGGLRGSVWEENMCNLRTKINNPWKLEPIIRRERHV